MATLENFGYTIEELTSEWLTRWMRSKEWLNESQSVTNFTSKRIGEGFGYTTCIFRLNFEFSEDVQGVPSSLVIKLPKLVQTSASNDFFKGFFRREYEFYEYYKNNPCPIRIPKYYYGYFENETGNFVLLMEDLAHGTGRMGDQVNGAGLAHTKIILTQLARFHASWWKSAKLDDLDWIATGAGTISFSAPFFVMCWKPFIAEFQEEGHHLISPNILKLGDYLLAELPNFSPKKYFKGPYTLIHGDYRADNMFFWDEGDNGGDSVCILDFQVLHPGNCAEDVAYYMSCGLTAEEYKAHKSELLQLYHNTLIESGVTDYPFEEFLDDFREHLIIVMIFPVFSAYQKKMSEKRQAESGSTPERMDSLFVSWFERALASVEFELPDAAEFMERRWAHIERQREDPLAHIDEDLRAFISLVKQFIREYKSEMGVPAFQSDEVGQLKSSIEFHPPEKCDSVITHTLASGVTVRLLIPLDSAEIERFTSLNVYLPESKFIRGTVDSDYLSYRRVVNISKQPMLVVAFPFTEKMQYPSQVDHLISTLQWLSSEDGKAWLATSSANKLSTFDLHLLGNGAGGHFAYSAIVRNIQQNLQLNIKKYVALHPPFNPNCNDESFIEAGDKYPTLSSSAWKALWDEYLPAEVILSAYSNPEVFVEHLKDDIISQFPKSLIVYSEFDPNRKSAELLISKLKPETTNTHFVSGTIALVFAPNFKKGNEIFNKVSEFINSN